MSFKKIAQRIALKLRGNRMIIGDFNLKMSRGHSLPYILADHPEYASALVRFTKHLSSGEKKPLKIIDVGANVGDSIAMLLSDNKSYHIAGIEGDPVYHKILSENMKGVKNVDIYENFLGEHDTKIDADLNRRDGTMRFENNQKNSGSTIQTYTLDTFLEKNPFYADARALKIDTDGYDNQILRGGKKYLQRAQPVIYFEYDTNYLKANGETGTDIFDFLKSCGYKTLAFYDNYGRFILSTTTENTALLKQLDRYTDGRAGAYAYYDIVAFPASAETTAQFFVEQESKRR